MNKILIIEDDREIVRHLELLLKGEGFSCIHAYTREDALTLIGTTPFDLALVDITLPDGSGYSLCTAIRQKGDIPVIFLTALGDESSTVTGFDLGADDYIAKPFRPLELISRIKNALRRSGRTPSVLRIFDLKVDPAAAKVTKNGEQLFLTALEYRLLLVFFNHPGEVLSRNRLLEELWDAGGDFVNDNTLTVYIKRLREKIGDDPASPRIIRTVRGLGYAAGEKP